MEDKRSTKDLFKEWRGGDGQAGQLMAQRFADWYYAIATSRLGEGRGRGPCDAACQAFGQGVVGVTESRALVTWAHRIIQDELAKAGSAARDGDEANAYTANATPKALLVRAKASLGPEVSLLELVYGGASEEEVTAAAESLGGNPIGVLKARYRVKKWLVDNADVPFAVTPDDPVLDRAPLPQYESMKMANDAEMTAFEQWMLTDLDLCRDIAEFATFAVALRGGLEGVSAAKPAPATKTPRAAANAGGAPPAQQSQGVAKPLVLLVVGGIALVVLVTSAVVVVRFLL